MQREIVVKRSSLPAPWPALLRPSAAAPPGRR